MTCYHNSVISTIPQLLPEVATGLPVFHGTRSNFYFCFQNVLELNRQCNSCLTAAWANEPQLFDAYLHCRYMYNPAGLPTTSEGLLQ